MKIIDLQPTDILVTFELRLAEIRAIVAAFEDVTITPSSPEGKQNAKCLTDFAKMLGEFVDGFDNGTGFHSS